MESLNSYISDGESDSSSTVDVRILFTYFTVITLHVISLHGIFGGSYLLRLRYQISLLDLFSMLIYGLVD